VACVGIHDFGDQPMADDVGAGQFGDVNIVDAFEDVDRGP
jgi:hypothetical protein